MIRVRIATLASTLALAASVTAAHAQTAPTPGETYAPVGASPAQAKVPAPTETMTPPRGNGYQTFVQRRETFVTGDYLIHPRVYDEFTPGTGGKASYRIRGGSEFNIGNVQGLLEGESRTFTARHESGLVTTIGKNGTTFVPAFDVQENQLAGRLGIKLLEPRIYLGLAYLTKSNNAGYPSASGLGLGLEKLPDKEGPLSVYFSTYFYPNLTGAYHAPGPNPGSLGISYRVLTYEIGAAIKPSGSPIFLNVGLLGDRTIARNSSPLSQTRIAPYAGIGFFTR